MVLVKHPVHGNKHVDDSEVSALTAQGWVKWPRSADEKALGDGSAAGYWRAKFEAEAAKKLAVEAAKKLAVEVDESDEVDDPESPDAAPAKRRGRPPKV